MAHAMLANQLDSIADVDDRCSRGSDLIDTDQDTVPDACDLCAGNNRADSDGDGLPYARDDCSAPDQDADLDGVADGCDVCPDFADQASSRTKKHARPPHGREWPVTWRRAVIRARAAAGRASSSAQAES